MRAKHKQFSVGRGASRAQPHEFRFTRALRIGALSLALVVVAGCATPPAHPPKLVVDCPYKATQEGVTVGVEPLFDQHKLKQYFNTDLVSRHILPVLVVVKNDSTGATYWLMKSNCWLVGAAGLASKQNLSTRHTEALLIGGGVGGALAANAASQRVALADKEMRDQTVASGESEQGFVCFNLPEDHPAKGTSMSIRVRLPRTGSGQELNFELPITWER